MQIYHNSRDKKYRNPVGAVRTGEKIRLSVLIQSGEMPEKAEIRLWNGAEQYIEMTLLETMQGEYLYSAEFEAPAKPQLLWYYFVVKVCGKTLFYSNNPKRLGGVGVMEDNPSDISYQITVYDKDFKTPDWFKDAIMYQIFPDRFFREGEKTQFLEKKSSYRMHDDWYEGFFFDKHPYENGPACNDFYGGNLKGIVAKLDYLKELGISVIYLNPIFEAFSNHRYDTGDYSKIDPILGSEGDFKELCEKAGKIGIRIILDGVFSHTGSDSVYFNKYGSYGENTGASRKWDSPYAKWYQWNDDGSYNSWWGCSNLPNVNETEPTYIDYILRSEDAIIKKWLRLGAFGWRLDVADELPDDFIKILRKEVKSVNPEAMVIGEVWEDASNKVSYSEQREYLYGHELDSVMNYPFKDCVLGFLLGGIQAEDFAERMLSIMENYPKDALYTTMNLIGTHDTMRAKTVLGGQYIDENMSPEEKQKFRLDAHSEILAINRLKAAAFMQMTFVGVPCIYYGDEIGMQGLKDPFNRCPYTWRSIDLQLLEHYKRLTRLRCTNDCLKTGGFEVLYAKGDVIVYQREISGATDVFGNKAKNGTAICCINRSSEQCHIEFEMPDGLPEILTGSLSGKTVAAQSNTVSLVLSGHETEVFLA
ncbi:MAG: glycoside hydrolase family 13 protein [Clostridia bacterium]|nr:glycoside hydrolase family 13 protein [Clostridia bacterium]